jgi:FkbM family methyltransferase
MTPAGMKSTLKPGSAQADINGMHLFRSRGLEFFHYNKTETQFLYDEIFERRVYSQHGLTLNKGDVVWDVGANIGLFTIFVQEHVEDVHVRAFEPAPEIYGILLANTARYGQRVVAHCCGLAGQEGEATFAFYPSYSIMSGFHTHEQADRKTLEASIRSAYRHRYPDEEVDDRFLDDIVTSALNGKREHLCPLRTISGLIEETGVAQIALLKIDAEGSELDILAGIRDEHWPRIQQAIIEVHQGQGEVQKLLDARGFQTVLEEEATLGGSGIVNCYAIRRYTARS